SFLLNTISLVCKEWYNHVYDHPPLWHTLNISSSNLTSFKRFYELLPQKWGFVKILTCEEMHGDLGFILENSKNFTSLTQLTWSFGRFKNLNQIAQFTKLTVLELRECNIQNVDRVSDLINLTEFSLKLCSRIGAVNGI